MSNGRRSRFASLSSFVVVLSTVACGGGDHTIVPEPSDTDAGPSRVNSGVNVCPLFDGSLVMPQRIGPGETSFIAVSASDPDAPSSSLVFAWTTASGTFTNRDKPVTTYRCGDVGTTRLTLTATDSQGCTNTLELDVECVAN